MCGATHTSDVECLCFRMMPSAMGAQPRELLANDSLRVIPLSGLRREWSHDYSDIAERPASMQ